MTYQAASGAGAQNMRELLAQMGAVAASRRRRCSPIPRSAILEIDREVARTLRGERAADRASSACRSPAA